MSGLEDPERALIRSIIAFLRSSTDPARMTLVECSLSSITNGSARPGMLEVDAGRGIGTEELAAAKMLADGRSVADGSLGRVRRGIGGIVER